MDYRITFIYDDGSVREKYAATHTDVENIVVHELQEVNKHQWSVTIRVSNITMTEPPQL